MGRRPPDRRPESERLQSSVLVAEILRWREEAENVAAAPAYERRRKQ